MNRKLKSLMRRILPPSGGGQTEGASTTGRNKVRKVNFQRVFSLDPLRPCDFWHGTRWLGLDHNVSTTTEKCPSSI